MKILIMNGPNLNLLGRRDPKHYGSQTLAEINEKLKVRFGGVDLDFFQSNHEGELIDRLQQADGSFDGVVLNAGALTHYSIALRDAIDSVEVPVVEVHLSNIAARESFRNHSVIAPVCRGSISGFGMQSYVLGIQAIIDLTADGEA